jgi:hypothetical protein
MLTSTFLPQAEAKRSTWSMLAFLGLSLRQYCQFWTLSFLLKYNFCEEINENKGNCHQCHCRNFVQKCLYWKTLSVEHDFANKPSRINTRTYDYRKYILFFGHTTCLVNVEVEVCDSGTWVCSYSYCTCIQLVNFVRI